MVECFEAIKAILQSLFAGGSPPDFFVLATSVEYIGEYTWEIWLDVSFLPQGNTSAGLDDKSSLASLDLNKSIKSLITLYRK